MIRHIKYSRHCLNLQVLINPRNFGSSSVISSWRERIRPININEEEKDDVEKYLEKFKSRKGLSSDVMQTVGREIRLSEVFTLEGFKRLFQNLKKRALLIDQRYIDKRIDMLGYDLAAAHFVVHRGGKVRFKGQDKWVERDEDHEYDIPRIYDPNYLLEELDASKMPIVYDGLQNLDNLHFLKVLNMSHCPNLDDWCLDRICGHFSQTLEQLDVSHCPLITNKGLESIGRLRSLTKLNVSGLDHLPNLKLICLLLEDAIPNLEIGGVSY